MTFLLSMSRLNPIFKDDLSQENSPTLQPLKSATLLKDFSMLRESSKAWSNGSEAYSSDPDEEEEEDMVFGEPDQDGVAEEMMDLSDLPTALFACNVHEATFEDDVHRVGSSGGGCRGGSRGSQCCLMSFPSCAAKFVIAKEWKPDDELKVHVILSNGSLHARPRAAFVFFPCGDIC